MTRGNGARSVYQRRSHGRWVAARTELDVDGALCRQVPYASRQAAARRLLREALQRVAPNQPGVDQSIPLGDYARQWVQTTLAVRDVKASARLVYADALGHWVLPTLGAKRLRDLRPSDVEHLLAHLQRRSMSATNRRSPALAEGQPWQETDLVVTTDVGTLWDPSNARKALRPVVAAVGAPGVSFHGLRHAAALLLEEGVPIKVASELLGHFSTLVTEGIYAHVTHRLVDEDASALERGLSCQQGPGPACVATRAATF